MRGEFVAQFADGAAGLGGVDVVVSPSVWVRGARAYLRAAADALPSVWPTG